MKRLKTLAVLLAGAALCAAISGCAGKAEGGVAEEKVSDYEPVTAQNFGRTLTISERPSSVVTAGPNCTEVFAALGISDIVVGNSCDNHSRGPLEQWAADYAKIPELTYGYPTLEAVVSSGCDFIYAIDWVFEGDFTVEALEEYGITVYVCEATDYDGIWKEIETLGRIFEAEAAAESFIAGEKARIAEVSSAIEGCQRLKVFVYDSDTGSGVYTAGGSNIETAFIETAGGSNIFSELEKAWTGVSYEEILARAPDAMIIHDYEEATYEENIASLKADPILSQLDCVKNERFIKLSLESALPGSRTAYSIEEIARGLFPESFGE